MASQNRPQIDGTSALDGFGDGSASTSDDAPLARVERPWLFQPGNRANPGGRPKGVAALVREQTEDGAEMIAFMLAVMRGRKKVNKALPSLAARMEAAAWLADRAFGKAMQQVEVGGVPGDPLVIRVEYGSGSAEDDDDR